MYYLIKAMIGTISTIILLIIGFVFGFIDNIRESLSFSLRFIVFLDFAVAVTIIYCLNLYYFKRKEVK